MLVERRQWVIGAIAGLVIAGATAFAVAGAGSSVFVPGTRMSAEFTDAAGLETGDFVFVSGVRAGEVTDVERVPQSEDPEYADEGPIVRAEFALRTDARVPADTRAEIFLYSPLGRRGIGLTPDDTSTEHLEQAGALEEGDLITLGRTSTLTDLPEFGTDTTDFLEDLDVEALRGLTTGLADVTEDQREDVDRLFDGVQQVSGILVDRREQLARTLDRAEALVDVAESRDDEVLEIIDNFQVTLDTLLAKQDEIERMLVETANTSEVAADFVSDERARIDRVVRDLTEALEVVDDHQVDLAHTMPYLAQGLDGFSSIGYLNLAKEDTGQWGNVFVTGLGEAGLEATLGCGSDVDALLTEVFGPDPTCAEGNVDQGRDPEGASASTGMLDEVFRTGLQAQALGSTTEGTR